MKHEIIDYEAVQQYEPQWCEAVLELVRLADTVEELFTMFSIS